MAESTRRSSRRREKTNYAVGDFVEITRDATLVTGRLVSFVAESEGTAKPRWLVAFDDEPASPDAEVLESDMGPVNELPGPVKRGKKTSRKSSDDSVDTGRTSPATRGSPRGSKATNGKSSPVSTDSMTSDRREDDTPDDAVDSSSGSKRSSNNAVSREERSKRRQAMIDEEKIQAAKRPTKKKKMMKGDEDVVRVPLLTGTLYLYRGLHARAEFVRKV